MPRRPPPVSRRQGGVFLTEQAYADGWTPQHLRGAVTRGEIDRLWRGAFATPVPATAQGSTTRLLQRSVAACLSAHDVAVSHLAAATIRDLPTWAPSPRPCVTAWASGLAAVGDVHVHRAPLAPAERRDSAIGPVTSVARAVVDIAREFGVESALVTADAALRDGALTPATLVAALQRARGAPGVAAARDLADLVDERSESALESRSRHRIRLAGLPAPSTQVDLFDVHGTFIARVDFFWPEFGVVGEADGLDKYERDPSRRRTEQRREKLLDHGLGLVVESWGWRDLDPFGLTARRLTQAFTAGQQRTGPRRWRLAGELAA